MTRENTLLKRGWRSDSIWTLPLFYGKARAIPIFFDTRALLKSQYWPRAKIATLQATRLSTLFKEAARLPFWQERFAEAGISADTPFSPSVLARLPVISKKDFIGLDPAVYSDPSLYPRSYLDHTSGSTGRPFAYYFDWFAELRCFAIVERTVRTATDDVRYPVLSMRARPRVGFIFQNHYMFVLHGYNSVKHRIDALIEEGKRFSRGFILYGYTSSLIEVARRVRAAGAVLPLRAVIATGEGIRPSDRTMIEENLGTDFFLCYATRELGWLGYECNERAMHLNEEWAYFEIVDDEGRAVEGESEGRVVVTTFDNHTMPFIHYDIGDRGSISQAPCLCGRTLRTIRFAGRKVEMIELEDSRSLSLLDLSAAFDAFYATVHQFQIIQNSPRSFTIKVVPGPLFEERRGKLHDRLVRLMHPHVEIVWEIVEEIPQAQSGKAAYFIRAPRQPS